MPAGVVALAAPAQAVSADIVIAEVYGAGGNSGATLKQDFIELYNRGAAEVSVEGWSVQYASSTGVSWQVTQLVGVIPPGRSYLVGEGFGSGGT
ncbi:MAG: lamin tail domain-containing protein, partial [Geodermatophilaceae bacterium]|nr:lamin tail domain-containing protein [Geodermatophilaceae bacterium]